MQIEKWFLDICEHHIGALVLKSTIETSVFGAEFVTMKQGIDALRGLRYRLRMIGIPISGPSYIYGDNMSVMYNTSRPEPVLRKMSNSGCHHAVHESVAMGESLAGHILSKENVSDRYQKFFYGQKRRHMVSNMLYEAHDDH